MYFAVEWWQKQPVPLEKRCLTVDYVESVVSASTNIFLFREDLPRIIVQYFQPTCVLAAVFTDPFHRQKAVFKQTKTDKNRCLDRIRRYILMFSGHIKKKGVWFCLFIVHYRGAAIQFIPIANLYTFSHFPTIVWSFVNINSLVAVVMNSLF